jgi:hypothetical protein
MTVLAAKQLAASLTIVPRPDNEPARRRFAILGSCVSSDIFRLNPGLGHLVSYHARSSLLSLMSSPLELGDDGRDWPSNFARLTIKADFEKTFFADLEALDCDTLIVDFVDERWDLLRVGNSVVTCSGDLMRSRVDRLSCHQFLRFARMDPRTHVLWRDACARFAETLRERLPGLRVVLHKVLGADRYRDGRKVCELVPFADGIQLGGLNAMLEDYNACFRSHMDSVLELELPRTYVADKSHLWGLGPFHYEERYYVDAANVLESYRSGYGKTEPHYSHAKLSRTRPAARRLIRLSSGSKCSWRRS